MAELVGLSPATFRAAMILARKAGVDCRRPREEWLTARIVLWDVERVLAWRDTRPGRGGSTPRKYTDAQRQTAIEAYLTGMSLRQAGALVGTGGPVVGRWLQDAGLRARPRNPPTSPHDEGRPT